MPDILRAGLVGCGSLAQRGVLPHLSEPDAREKVRLVAVADALEERARQSAERFGVPASFTGVDAILAGAELDVVLITTPITQHYADAMAAVAAGKHVYVQKAMTVTLEEADALLAARDRAGVKLAAAPGYELFPLVGELRAAVAGGEIGPAYAAYTYTMGFGHEREPIRGQEGVLAAIDPSWYYRAGAGPLPDVTVYSLQLITSVLGPVREVTALANQRRPERTWRGQTIRIEIADNNVVLLGFESGAIGVAVGSDSTGSATAPWGGMEIYGGLGTLTLDDVDHASGYPVRATVRGRGTARTLEATLADQPYLTPNHAAIEEPHVYADIMDLVDAIRDDRPARSSGEQARHVVEIIQAAHAAAATGQTQRLTSTFSPSSE
jgi:predicted dehydrogenase